MFLTKTSTGIVLHDGNVVKVTGFTYAGRMPASPALPHIRGSWFDRTYILRDSEKRILRYIKGFTRSNALVVEEYRDYHY